MSGGAGSAGWRILCQAGGAAGRLLCRAAGALGIEASTLSVAPMPGSARLAAWISSNFATATYSETANSLSVAYDGNRLILNDLELQQQFPDAADYPAAPPASPSKPPSVDHMLGPSFVSGGQVFKSVRMMAYSEVYLRCAVGQSGGRHPVQDHAEERRGHHRTTGASWP